MALMDCLLDKNWLDGHIQEAVINVSVSRWRSVTSGAPQRSVLGPVLLSFSICDTSSAIQCTLSKFTDDIMPRGVFDLMPFRGTWTS